MATNSMVNIEENIKIDEGNRTISGANGKVKLTPCEYSLLACLVNHAGCALSRSDLLRDAWHWDYACEVRTKTVDMHVRRLRVKFERAGIDPKLVTTVRGYGYAFKA